jgi:hypothetical protein
MGTGGGMTVGPYACYPAGIKPARPEGFPSKLVAGMAGKGE